MLLDNMAKRQELSGITKEARAILERAERAKRAMTPEENQKYDALIARANPLKKEIERLENHHAVERFVDGEGSLNTPPSQGHSGRAPSFDVADGEVRGFRHGQAIAEYVRRAMPDNVPAGEWQLRRFLRGSVTGHWDGAELERRTHLEGSAAAGGIFVPTTVGAQIIDLARNESRLSQAGMVTIPMTSPKMVLGRVATDPTPYWRPENSTITESEASYEGATMEAKTIAILTSCSVELLEDAAGFTTTIEGQIAAAIALEIDRVGLFGNGVQEPQGIYGAPGVQEISLGANGAVPTNVDSFSEACEALLLVNGNPTAAIYSPRTWGTIDRMLDGEGRPLAHPQSYVDLKKLTRRGTDPPHQSGPGA